MSRSDNFRVSARGARLFGSNDLDAMFPDEAPTTTLSNATYNRRKGYDRTAVREAVNSDPKESDFQDYDPRELSVSQPAVTRGGVRHYLSGDYEKTGETFADKDNPGNKFPTVYERNDGSEKILLAGHHRMAARLLQGAPLRARRVQGP